MAKKNILLKSKKKKALSCYQAGEYAQAWDLYSQICQQDRMDPEAWLMAGVVAGLRGDSTAAADCCRKAIALAPSLPTAHFNLGVALRAERRYAEAIQCFEHALSIQPKYSEALESLAQTHIDLCDWDNAVRVLRAILEIWPQKAEIHSNLGSVYQVMGRSEEAIAAYRAALRLKPQLTGTLNCLGSAYMGRGDFEQAEDSFRQCLALAPADLRARSNLLMLLNYLPEVADDAMLAEHRHWDEAARRLIQPMAPAPVDADPGRRLRIGYLSPDFREHSVAAFIEPLLRGHDRSQFEVCCYSHLPRPDDTTRRLRGHADLWRDIDRLSDAEVAHCIREDRIDLLVDLAGHTSNHRLGVFVARPAPLQFTYLGYPNTTGLAAMDYRITDAIADPPGAEARYSEGLLRLDGCFLCYQPDPDTPPVAPLPARERGVVTFGSFNNFSKINPGVLAAWAAVLRRVPDARLLVKCPALTDAGVREQLLSGLQGHGIGAERLELLGHTRTRAEHLALYARMDIALDTFPYNGTTTTCEALWMGVPVVSLATERHAGRVGASLLHAIGQADWVASSLEDYAAIAAGLASDLHRLQSVRAHLRDRMSASTLCSAEGFVRHFEAACRAAWQRWCASVTTPAI